MSIKLNPDLRTIKWPTDSPKWTLLNITGFFRVVFINKFWFLPISYSKELDWALREISGWDCADVICDSNFVQYTYDNVRVSMHLDNDQYSIEIFNASPSIKGTYVVGQRTFRKVRPGYIFLWQAIRTICPKQDSVIKRARAKLAKRREEKKAREKDTIELVTTLRGIHARLGKVNRPAPGRGETQNG